MNAPQTALLLIGSPKSKESSSESLGTYLFEELAARGVRTQTIKLVKALHSAEATEELRAAVAASDLIVLSFPLYVDSLPAPTMLALEQISAWAASTSADGGEAPATGHRPAFVAICQSGFPEVVQNEIAIEICRNFAAAAGFEWAGGLILAAGGMVGGQPLRKIKGMMRSAVSALDLTADALAAGTPLPDEAVARMAKPAFPRAGYRFMANWGWRSQLKKDGDGTPLDAQPFA
ncbi:MAG TPA: NAD(P)H-dependent oxidoreductase [Thermoleophilia bacterium]|nr:NAD(P)H-dependent oxidoreductase [Thermoleophilia bacterium]